MADRVVITTEDLEQAVRLNAHLEGAGFATELATSLDEVRAAVRTREPDCLIVTGGLHEPTGARVVAVARDRAISTLGLVEATEPDAKGLARELGLTAFLSKPADPAEVAATVRRLLESELFGHEKGAFTGAAERRLGRFELADGGTIFLDEVGEMAAATQVKLLRVLEDRSFFRVGGTQPIRVDVRVVAATNQSLKEAVSLGRFRDDLFYRLNVLSVYLPPLRERRSDIPLLVRTFITEFAKPHDRTFRGITPEALQLLVDADWPGNVRQLRNLVESMVVLAPEGEIRASDIPRDIREHGGGRGLPMRLVGATRQVAGQELEFIFRSLVELKLQVEELRRRLEERAPRVG